MQAYLPFSRERCMRHGQDLEVGGGFREIAGGLKAPPSSENLTVKCRTGTLGLGPWSAPSPVGWRSVSTVWRPQDTRTAKAESGDRTGGRGGA